MSHKKRLFIIFSTLGVFMLFMVWDMHRLEHHQSGIVAAKPDLSDTIWSLTMSDLDGNIVPFTNLMGAPAVIQVWSSRCIYCTQEMQRMTRFYDEYYKQVRFVAITRDTDIQQANSFVTLHDPEHKLWHWYEEGDLFFTLINGVTEPETVFLTSDGKIFQQVQGPISDQEMHDIIAHLLP